MPSSANAQGVTNVPGTTETNEVPEADHRQALPVTLLNGRDLVQATKVNPKRDRTHLVNHVLSSQEDRVNSATNAMTCTILTQLLLPKTKNPRKNEIVIGLDPARESLGTDFIGEEVGEEAKKETTIPEERVETEADPADLAGLADPANQVNPAEEVNLAVHMTLKRNTK